LQHCQPQIEPSIEAGQRLRSFGPQVLLEHFLQIRKSDSPAPQGIAVAIFGKVRMAAEDMAAFFHRLVEFEVFERVQRVVMNEDGDRALRRQQVRSVLDTLAQLRDTRSVTPRFV
jgi:hypothetical protein